MSCAESLLSDPRYEWQDTRARARAAWVGIILLFALGLAFALCGCAGTVRPVIPKDAQASFDGVEQNSGVLYMTADHSAVITPHARDRYNALIQSYGGAFSPPLKIDDGITPGPAGAYLLNPQHVVCYSTMNRWRKEGKPISTPK